MQLFLEFIRTLLYLFAFLFLHFAALPQWPQEGARQILAQGTILQPETAELCCRLNPKHAWVPTSKSAKSKQIHPSLGTLRNTFIVMTKRSQINSTVELIVSPIPTHILALPNTMLEMTVLAIWPGNHATKYAFQGHILLTRLSRDWNFHALKHGSQGPKSERTWLDRSKAV